MKTQMNINEEMICGAIKISWAVALGAEPNSREWFRCWRSVNDELEGMRNLLLWGDGSRELVETVRFLRDMAETHEYALEKKDDEY